jgi:hypothetical protein
VVAQKVKVEEGPGQRQQVPMFVEEKLPQVDPDPPVKVQVRLEEVPWSSSSPVKLASPVRMGPRRPSKVTVKLKVSISKVGGSNCFLWPNEAPPPPSGSLRADVPDLVSEGDGRMFQGVPWPSP